MCTDLTGGSLFQDSIEEDRRNSCWQRRWRPWRTPPTCARRRGPRGKAARTARGPGHNSKGKLYCVGSEVRGRAAAAEWPAAGIVRAEVRERLRMPVCCFDSEIAKPTPVRLGDFELMVPTHQEGHDSHGNDDDFPDLIEDDAHAKSVSIRGDLWDGERPGAGGRAAEMLGVEIRRQYAFQFTVINRSADSVEIDWDHLRQMRARGCPVRAECGGRNCLRVPDAEAPARSGRDGRTEDEVRQAARPLPLRRICDRRNRPHRHCSGVTLLLRRNGQGEGLHRGLQ